MRAMSSGRERARVRVSERERWASSWAPVCMGMSVMWKVEMLYWLGVGGGDLVLGAVGEVEIEVAGAGGGDDGLLGGGNFSGLRVE